MPSESPAQTRCTTTSVGTVGEGPYVVQEGDCLESIGFAHGLRWQTIWDAPQNVELKRSRNPNILLPGDRVFVPRIRPKSVECTTDTTHQFLRRGVPSRLRMRVVKWEPAATETNNLKAGADTSAARLCPQTHLPYTLEIDGCLISGKTDSSGWIDQPISPGARFGSLTFEPGTVREQKLSIVLGGLDPCEADSGTRQRLANLGFDTDSDDPASEPFHRAVTAFQEAVGLQATGSIDDVTREKLKALHGS